MSAPLDPALLEPPDDATVARALRAFAAAVRRHFGDRLRGLYLFGSRARGDHTPESDADVAVVLADDGWTYWDEKMALSDLTYEMLLEDGVYLQAWPVTITAWRKPETHHNPDLVLAMHRDGVAIRDVTD
jgi:antitoxin ChpS